MAIRTFTHSIAALDLYNIPIYTGYYSTGYLLDNVLTTTIEGDYQIRNLDYGTYHFFKDGTCELSYSHSTQLLGDSTYGYFDFQQSLFNGLNDFTIEFFIKPEMIDAEMESYTLFDLYLGSQFGQSKYVKLTLSPWNSLSKINYPGANGIQSWVPAGKRITNEWIHVAVTRQGTTLRTFFNGVKTQEIITASINTSGQTLLSIGKSQDSLDGTKAFIGKVHSLRLLIDQCLYTTDFNIPTTDLSATGYGSTNQSINSSSLKLLSLLNNNSTSVIGPSITMSGSNYKYSYEAARYKQGYYSGGCYVADSLAALPYTKDLEGNNNIICYQLTAGNSQWYLFNNNGTISGLAVDGYNRFGYSVNGYVTPLGGSSGLQTPNASLATDVLVPLYYNNDGTVQQGFYGNNPGGRNSIISLTVPASTSFSATGAQTFAYSFSALPGTVCKTQIYLNGVLGGTVLSTTAPSDGIFYRSISVTVANYDTILACNAVITNNSIPETFQTITETHLSKYLPTSIGTKWYAGIRLKSTASYSLTAALNNSLVDLGSNMPSNEVLIIRAWMPPGYRIQWRWSPLTGGTAMDLTGETSFTLNMTKYSSLGPGYFNITTTSPTGGVYNLRFRVLSFSAPVNGIVASSSYGVMTIFRQPNDTYGKIGSPCYLNVVFTGGAEIVSWYKAGKKDPIFVLDTKLTGIGFGGSTSSCVLPFDALKAEDAGVYYAVLQSSLGTVVTTNKVFLYVRTPGYNYCTGGYYNQYGERSEVPSSYDIVNNPLQVVVNNSLETYEFSPHGTILRPVYN